MATELLTHTVEAEGCTSFTDTAVQQTYTVKATKIVQLQCCVLQPCQHPQSALQGSTAKAVQYSLARSCNSTLISTSA